MKSPILCMGAVLSLAGCAVDTPSGRSLDSLHQSTVTASEKGGLPVERPYVARCIDARLRHMNADPSKVRFRANASNDFYGGLQQMAVVAGQAPPAAISTTVAATLVDIGFEVGEAPPSNGDAYFSVLTSIVGFTPLQESSQANYDADLVLLMGGAKRSVAVGDVTTSSILYRWDSSSRSWVSMTTHTARLPFWMDKRSGTISVGLKMGASGGHGWESIRIRSVSDAATVGAQVATLSSISKAFKFECT